MFRRDVACKTIVCMARDVLDGASSHDVGVHIDRIDRVGDAHDVVCGEDVTDIARVALGTIADKHLLTIQLDATSGKVVSDDGIDEEIVAMFRTIPTESLAIGTFIHSMVHRLDGSIG